MTEQEYFDTLIESIYIYKDNFGHFPGKITLSTFMDEKVKAVQGEGNYNTILGIPVAIDKDLAGAWVLDK